MMNIKKNAFGIVEIILYKIFKKLHKYAVMEKLNIKETWLDYFIIQILRLTAGILILFKSMYLDIKDNIIEPLIKLILYYIKQFTSYIFSIIKRKKLFFQYFISELKKTKTLFDKENSL